MTTKGPDIDTLKMLWSAVSDSEVSTSEISKQLKDHYLLSLQDIRREYTLTIADKNKIVNPTDDSIKAVIAPPQKPRQ